MDIEALRVKIHKAVDEQITQWAAGAAPETKPAQEITEVKDKPTDKRVVRTPGQGDRVYEIDETKKTRTWLTNPQVLEARGWTAGDVGEVDDAELLKYQMLPAVTRVD